MLGSFILAKAEILVSTGCAKGDKKEQFAVVAKAYRGKELSYLKKSYL